MNPIASRAPHPAMVLIGALIFLICLIFTVRPVGIIFMFLVYLGVGTGLGVRFGGLPRELRRIWPFLLFTFLIHLLVSGRGMVAWGDLGRLDLKDLGWAAAGLFTLRLALIAGVAATLLQIHPPQRYGREVGRFLGRLPFGRGGLAHSELIVTLALRLIPFLEDESRRLRLALAARGVGLKSGRQSRLVTQRQLLMPLILNAFRRADHVSLALEARGWDPRVRRTSLNSAPVPKQQWIILVVLAGMCLVGVWL